MDTTETITHLGLCAGYGGIELGLKRVLPALRTVALCEIEAFACANLVAKMEAGLMDASPIWTDLKTFPWAEFRDRVDILTGGYPCQPFSSAGKRLGTDDPRHLWPHIASGIRLLRPRVCFFENVEGHISLGLREVIAELESLGYETTFGIFSAAECGASHQRKRVFICAKLANARHQQPQGRNNTEEGQQSGAGRFSWSESASCYVDVWPARPGQCQHAWEPPRVVANTISGRGEESEHVNPDLFAEPSGSDTKSVANASTGRRSGSGLPVRPGQSPEATVDAAGTSESVGNATEQGCERSTGTNDPRRYINGSAEPDGSGADWCVEQEQRQTEPTLGLCADESSSVLGETLTLNPYGDNVDAFEELSEKARARQILFEVWSKANTQEVQWTNGGLQCFLAEKILRTGMQLGAFTQRICYFVWCVQTGHPIQGWGLSGMWIYDSCWNPSQGQEPIEQFKRELGYALCQLSYEIALERGEEALEKTAILQGVRQASERAWALSNALPEMEEVWRSTLDQKVWENGCYVEAASQGNRTDELRLLGNGVVPATAEKAFRTLWQELNTHN